MSSSLRARLTTIVARLLLAAVVAEAFSFVGFLVATRHLFTYARLDRQRERQIKAAAAVRPGAAHATTQTVPHPYVGFTYDPNFDPAGMREFHSVPVSDWGFLDDKAPLQAKSEEQVVVGIFGGSVAFWFSVQGVDALFEELARVPEFQGKRLVPVRIALGAFKQPQQLLALSYLLGLGGHFDVVINIDGFNESTLALVSNRPSGVFPFYPNNWPGLLGSVGDPAMVRLVGEVSFLEGRRGGLAAAFSKPPLRYSVSANLLWKVLDLRAERQIDLARLALEKYKPDPAATWTYAARGPGRPYADPEALYADLAKVWQHTSLEMHRLCVGNGIRYFHFLQPNQYLEGSKPMSAGERKVALWPGSSWETGVRSVYPRLRAAGRELEAEGVAFQDLTQVFTEIGKPLYIDSCCHLNPEGNKLLGHRIGESIRKALERSPTAGAGVAADPAKVHTPATQG
jgi:hypothetical protein